MKPARLAGSRGHRLRYFAAPRFPWDEGTWQASREGRLSEVPWLDVVDEPAYFRTAARTTALKSPSGRSRRSMRRGAELAEYRSFQLPSVAAL